MAQALAPGATVDGDTIKVAGGTYVIPYGSAGDTAPGNPITQNQGITQNNLTIEWETPGVPAVIDASAYVKYQIDNSGDGHCIQVKPTCLNLTLRGLQIKGAHKSDSYGSGILSEMGTKAGNQATTLTVEYCRFDSFNNGILTALDGSANLRVYLRYSTFQDCGYQGYAHGLYIGASELLDVLGCTFKYTYAFEAHMLKSRSKVTTIRGCRFDDGGFASTNNTYGNPALGINNGGQFTFTGNVLLTSSVALSVISYGDAQQSTGQNSSTGTVDYMFDGRIHKIVMAQNTIRKLQRFDSVVFDVLKIYNIIEPNGTRSTVTVTDARGSTIRNNIVGSNNGSAALFVNAYPKNTVVLDTTIASSGAYSGGTVTGDPAANDAPYSYGGEYAQPQSRSDANRGGLSTDLPYALPSTGQAKAISHAQQNTAASVAPAPYASAPEAWNYSLFAHYGSGVFVEDYSSKGGFVCAHGGGHDVPVNDGACVFNFATGKWDVPIANANGVGWKNGTYQLTEIQSGELIASTPVKKPAPCHTYYHLQPVPASKGGGAKGSIVALVSRVQGSAGGTSTNVSYSMDLASGLWQRKSTNSATDPGFGSYPFDEGPAFYDPVANRYYAFAWGLYDRPTAVNYLDGSDWTWKVQQFGVRAPDWINLIQAGGFFINDPARNRRLIGLVVTESVPVGTSNTGRLVIFDLNDWANSPRTPPVTASCLMSRQNRWAYNPLDGCVYGYGGEGGNTIHKLTIPSDPMTGTWVKSTITVSGDTLPPAAGANSDQPYHRGGYMYTRFFYVPPLQCIAYIPDAVSPVYLIKPS